MVGPSAQSDLEQKTHFLKKMLYFLSITLCRHFIETPGTEVEGHKKGGRQASNIKLSI